MQLSFSINEINYIDSKFLLLVIFNYSVVILSLVLLSRIIHMIFKYIIYKPKNNFLKPVLYDRD